MDTVKEFKDNGYVVVPDMIPMELCSLFSTYALLKEKHEFNPEKENQQVPGHQSIYGDTFAETLLLFLQPHIEEITGLELCPTYTYYRVYRPGAKLKRHKDRESCEVSATVCFGYEYIGVDSDYRWKVYMDPESRKIPCGPNNPFVSANNKGNKVLQNIGDGVIYRGCEVEHWRKKFKAAEGSYQVQIFFHYIDKNGPHYPKFAYDGREFIGSPRKT